MLAEAAGFAFLAGISPTSLMVMAVFLGSASPQRTASAYLAGALAMTVGMAVALLFAIRAIGLEQPRLHDPRYGLRLALGILALLAALVIRLRRPRESGSGRGLMSRLIAQPSAGTAFVAGLVLFTPSLTFIAAVQVIATSNPGTPGTVLGLLIVVAITVLIVWLVLLAYLLAPDATGRRLTAFNDWLRANGKKLTIGGLVIGGVALVTNGALGLAGVF